MVLFNLLILLLLTGCATTQEIQNRKLENAKVRLNKIIKMYPELLVGETRVSSTTDTVIKNRVEFLRDSVYIKGGTRIDTVLQINQLDSLFSVFDDMIELKLLNNGFGQVRAQVKVVPHYIYETDTLKMTDTVFREKINTVTTNTINTKPNIFWSFWFFIKGWLWFILVVIAIIFIIRIVFKIIG
jgi:hypothetical protein